MNSHSLNEYELHYFSKEVCKYCKIAKPIYEEEIRPVFQMNGIPCYEYDTAEDTERIRQKKTEFQVKTVPTLIILETSPMKVVESREIFRGDSTTIRDSLKILQECYSKLDDSF
jgi:glutaredoxin